MTDCDFDKVAVAVKLLDYGNLTFERGTSGITVFKTMYDMRVRIKILKDKGSIRISADDIFHSWVYKNRSISLKQADYYQISETDTQRLGIAFTYTFGKDTFTRKSKHRDNALDEEKSRLQ